MRRPLFSIVIATFNYGRFLEDALQSLHLQSCQDYELIICDGGSTDCSVDIIKRFVGAWPAKTKRTLEQALNEGTHITWWCSETDAGQSDAFNKGFSHAEGRFLTWLNADDIFAPDALMSIADEIAKHPGCEWFIGSSMWADSRLRIARCFCAHRFSGLRAKYGYLTAGGPSSFFSKELFDRAGGVDESLHFTMDSDLWYKFYFNCGARYRRTRANVFIYRMHESSKMSGADVKQTESALRNRLRAKEEEGIVLARYHIKRGRTCARFVTMLTFSLVDKICSLLKSFKYCGKTINGGRYE